MARTTETIGFSVPPPVARQVERLAKAERRTKSELFREMVRVYERYSRQREQLDEEWVHQLIREVEQEEQEEQEEQSRPQTQQERDKEEAALHRYAEGQSHKLGIKEQDIDRIIHHHRQRRRNAGRA